MNSYFGPPEPWPRAARQTPEKGSGKPPNFKRKLLGPGGPSQTPNLIIKEQTGPAAEGSRGAAGSRPGEGARPPEEAPRGRARAPRSLRKESPEDPQGGLQSLLVRSTNPHSGERTEVEKTQREAAQIAKEERNEKQTLTRYIIISKGTPYLK